METQMGMPQRFSGLVSVAYPSNGKDITSVSPGILLPCKGRSGVRIYVNITMQCRATPAKPVNRLTSKFLTSSIFKGRQIEGRVDS